MGTARRAAEESIDHLIPDLPLRTPYLEETIIFQIQQLLDRHEFLKPWRKSPRLFTLLRMLQCDENVLQQFLNEDVNDFCLPLSEDSFNKLGVATDWSDFRQVQRHILSNPEHMSEAWLRSTPHLHRHLEYGEFTFAKIGDLGHGATAMVLRVQHTAWDIAGKGRHYACKRATRGNWRQQKEQIRLFVQELQILRKISHPHTVRLVASYTDMEHLALVLDPIADASLKDMLDNASVPLLIEDSISLRQWFGCLASALAYLHEQCIRHKDIKPSNILLNSGTVYLCDFGISKDWTGSNPTTEGPSYLTRGYCSPEVWRKGLRNDASDVWSLGRVFCDMFTILVGRPLDELLRRIDGDLHGVYEDGSLDILHEWLSELGLEDTPHDFLPVVIQQMVSGHFCQDIAHAYYVQMKEDRNARPAAKQVLQWFRKYSFSLERPFIGPCCQGGPDTFAEALAQVRCIASPKFSTGLDENVIHTELDATPRRSSLPAPSVCDANNDHAVIPSDRESTTPSISHSVTRRGIGHVVVENPGSSPSLSLGRRSTTTGRRTSFGESSTRSQQLVKWSSGSVLSPKPSPVSSFLTCNCVPRTNSYRVRERLVLRVSNVALSIKAKQPTIETNENCGLHQNVLHVYESHWRPSIERHMIWRKTRRLVVSHRHDYSSRQVCSSFWLPLTDVSFVLNDNSLALHWSDCNQWNIRPIGNNKQSCDCIYDSDNPNNEIVLFFAGAEMAVAFLEDLCTVYNDSDGVKEWRNVEIAGQQKLLTVDVRDQDTISYRLACLATHRLSSTSTFEVFIHWPNLDLDICIVPEQEEAQRAMIIRFDQVSSPHYTSNIGNEPWVDESKIARYKASSLVFSAYSMTFPFGLNSSSSLPEGRHSLHKRDFETAQLIEQV